MKQRTSGRGADGVVDAVGMEARGNPVAATCSAQPGYCPMRWGESDGDRGLTALRPGFRAGISRSRRHCVAEWGLWWGRHTIAELTIFTSS